MEMNVLTLAWWGLIVASDLGIAASGTGIYYYGPEVSENVACQRAETLAKMDAIRSVVGENIYADEFQQCTERTTEIKCVNNKIILILVFS